MTSQSPSPLRIGVWVWGIVGAFLGASVVWIIATGEPSDIYGRIQGSASAVGAILAGIAVAWSWFFQTSMKKDESDKFAALSNKLDSFMSDTSAKFQKFPSEVFEAI